MGPNIFQGAALIAAYLGEVPALAMESVSAYVSPHMTLVVQNRHNESIVMNDDSYTLMQKDPVLATGEHKIFKTGPWSGNFKVNEEKEGNTGQDTLIEFTLNNRGITVDVSFVAAFTVPAVCGCKIDGDEDVTLVTGCNIDLKKLNGGSCPPEIHNGHGGCMNPMRSLDWNTGATSFFKPCEGAAYTHEGDHQTTQNGDFCREGPIVCCIGSDCPPSMKQKNFNGTADDLYASGAHGVIHSTASRSGHRKAEGEFLSLSALLDLVPSG